MCLVWRYCFAISSFFFLTSDKYEIVNKRRGAPQDGEGQCAGCDASEGYVSDVELRLHDMHVHDQVFPACAQWCIFSIVRANFQKYDLYSAPIARPLPRYIVLFFKFSKTRKCFKTMLLPVSTAFLKKPFLFKNIPCCSSNPRHMQKYCLDGLKSVQQYRSSRAQTV